MSSRLFSVGLIFYFLCSIVSEWLLATCRWVLMNRVWSIAGKQFNRRKWYSFRISLSLSAYIDRYWSLTKIFSIFIQTPKFFVLKIQLQSASELMIAEWLLSVSFPMENDRLYPPALSRCLLQKLVKIDDLAVEHGDFPLNYQRLAFFGHSFWQSHSNPMKRRRFTHRKHRTLSRVGISPEELPLLNDPPIKELVPKHGLEIHSVGCFYQL